MKLEGKKALVTGASRGIGRAIALALAAEGADVVVNYAVSEAAAKEVAAEIVAMGRKAFVVQADISSNEAATAMVDEVVKEFGRIDILVNNAGITRDGLLMRMSEEDFSDVIDVNLKGTFHCIRFASRQMMKQRSGRIINMASVAGLYGNPGQINYSASKAAVIGMTKTVAKELGSRGVGVNAVAPGFIKTPMTDKLTEEQKNAVLNLIAMKRYGLPEEIAGVVSFLASEDSSYVTGQVIEISGGLSM